MITLLAKYLIKDYQNTDSPTVRQSYGVLCGFTGVVLNLLLFAGKFLAGILSHSIAITADAVNNLSDAGSSVVTMIGFKLAGQKPDPDHPFGHGRIEYLSGLAVAVIILIMGIELLKTSIEKIITPEELTFSPVILVILAASILVKAYMSYYNKMIGRKINSTAMTVSATDSISDVLSTTVVLIATIISHVTGFSIDGYCGVLVGLFICYAGFNAVKDTVNPLLGQAPDPEFVSQIEEIVLSYEGVIGIHDLIVHNYGPGRILISLHAEVPADGDILTMHDMIDLIEKKLADTLHCHAVIHMDPVRIDDPETQKLKAVVTGYLAQIHKDLTLHDFRIVTGPTHTNIIFDVVVPFQLKMTDREVRELLSAKISQYNPDYYAVIEVDHQYVV